MAFNNFNNQGQMFPQNQGRGFSVHCCQLQVSLILLTRGKTLLTDDKTLSELQLGVCQMLQSHV